VTTIVSACAAKRRLVGVLVLVAALTLTAAARASTAFAGAYPVQTQFTVPGPYATTTGSVTDSTGAVIYDLYYPSDYARLGFKSPIITWRLRDRLAGIPTPRQPHRRKRVHGRHAGAHLQHQLARQRGQIAETGRIRPAHRAAAPAVGSVTELSGR
jgi:hypothetical protein